MSQANLGSIAIEVFNRVDVPSSFSGTSLINFINQKMLIVQREVGATIGSVNIADDYQNVLTYYGCAEALRVKNALGVTAGAISLGELSINKSNSAALATAKDWEDKAEQEMMLLKGRFNYYKAFG